MATISAKTDRVRDVMTGHPATVPPDATLADVLAVMEGNGVPCCPVARVSGELCGIISQVDLLRAFRPSRELELPALAEVRRQRARDIMRYGVVSVEPDDPLVAALDLLVDTRLHTLPVVRRGPGRPMVVGLISQSDVLRHLTHPAAATAG